jgi:hypothetical protein
VYAMDIRGALLTCRNHVRFELRLWPRCLRLVGWRHTVASVLKSIWKYDPNLLDILDDIRALTQFFGVDTWRDHLCKVLQREVQGIRKLLNRFSASFFKIRCQTMVLVLTTMLPFQGLCENHIRGSSSHQCRIGT